MISSRPTLAIVLLIAFIAAGCGPTAPNDDAGHLSWSRQVVRHFLHRNVRGADEARLLRDLIGIVGRAEVARMLSYEPEFNVAWSGQMWDQLRVQRNENLAQDATCFDSPMRLWSGSDGGALAAFIRESDVLDGYPGVNTQPGDEGVPGGSYPGIGPFNLADVATSAIDLDDLRPLWKAYLVPVVTGKPSASENGTGKLFTRVYTDRADIGCTHCHNSYFSHSKISKLPVNLEQSLWGCDDCSTVVSQHDTKIRIFNIFRRDAAGGAGGTRPWGMDASCGTFASAPDPEEPPMPVNYAGISGSYKGVAALMERLDAGFQESWDDFTCAVPGSLGVIAETLDGDRALAFAAASTLAQNVWDDVLGSPLSLEHGFARNADQAMLRCQLTQRLLLSDWSLKDLLGYVVTRTEFNRRAPASSLKASASVLPNVFDPYFDENGQGDLLFRFPPHHLFRRLTTMLGWPEPATFSGADTYPTLEVVESMDQYLSMRAPGADDWGFQSLIAWEDTTALCAKPARMGEANDWFDQLTEGIVAFDAANPENPLSVRDVVETVRDWLLQDRRIEGVQYPEGNGGTPGPIDDFKTTTPTNETPLGPILTDKTGPTEADRLEDYLGVDLEATAVSVPGLVEKLRAYCGLIVKLPQFTLANMAEAQAAESPRLEVCNAGEPCGYMQLCQHYRPTLEAMGHAVECTAGGVGEPFDVTFRPTLPSPSPEIDERIAQAEYAHGLLAADQYREGLRDGCTLGDRSARCNTAEVREELPEGEKRTGGESVSEPKATVSETR